VTRVYAQVSERSDSPRTLSKSISFAGGRRAVLLLHGLASGPAELQYLARGLHKAGYSVHVPVLPGYSYGVDGSGAPARRGRGRAADWLAVALTVFDDLRAQYDQVAVGGLCIGAVLALSLAQQRAHSVAAVLCFSTTLHYDGWAVPWRRRLLPLAAYIPRAQSLGVPETEPFGVKDERLRAWIAKQMHEQGYSEAGAAIIRVGDLLEASRLMRRVRRQLSDVVAPILIVHAREDESASLRSAFELAERVRSKTIRLVILNDSYHMCTIDREKQSVLEETRAFIETHCFAATPDPIGMSRSR